MITVNYCSDGVITREASLFLSAVSDTEKTIQFFLNPDGAIQMILIRPGLYRSTNIAIQLWPPNPSCRDSIFS